MKTKYKIGDILVLELKCYAYNNNTSYVHKNYLLITHIEYKQNTYIFKEIFLLYQAYDYIESVDNHHHKYYKFRLMTDEEKLELL